MPVGVLKPVKGVLGIDQAGACIQLVDIAV